MKGAKAVIFLGGFLIGIGAGVAVSWRHFKKKSEKEIADFLDKVNSENKAISFEKSLKETEEKIEKYTEELVKEGIYPEVKTESYDYSEFVKGKKGPSELLGVDPAELEHPEEEEEERPGSVDTKDPDDISEWNDETENTLRGYEITKETQYKKGRSAKIISEDSYYNEYPQYDKVALQYYYNDDILATEEEEEIPNVEEVIGDALDKFGFRNNDERMMWVRNHNFGTDYEIFKVYTSFGEYPHGG